MDLLFLILQLLLLLSVSLSGDLKEHDALCGPGDSCYAVFYQRRTFLESWKACREKGGNLATVKNVQEAALVEQLLTSSTGSQSDGDVQLRLWIGLQRQPRQCAPQKPLRGFTWTTGDQDTAFTNWVSQAVSSGPQSPCSAARCVAIGLGYGKPEDDFKWSEGSCTLPVDGYICKFRYQGMCPTLTEGNVRYSVPFGYQGTWLDLLPFGTVAVVSCESEQQAITVLCTFKEDRTVGWDKEEPLCQDPDDLCEDCQQLCEEGVCACEEGYILQPDGHSCEPEGFEEQRCPCQYRCLEVGIGKGYECICPGGYELAADELSCEDIDECEDEETCEHSCENTLGSYKCSCDLGFAISEDDPERCVDIDECRFARMCQQMCVNHVGGFECFCNEGYELAADRVSCNRLHYEEPKNEPNPHVTSFESVFEPEHDTTEWQDLVDMESNSETEEYMPNSHEEITIIGSTTEEDLETTTDLMGWETHEEITTMPTLMPEDTTTSKPKANTIRTTTLHTSTPNIPSLEATVPSKGFFSTIKSKEQSKVNIWSGRKLIYDVPTTKNPAIRRSSWDMSKVPTVVPSRSRVNQDSQTTLKPKRVPTITTMASSDLPSSHNNSHAVSPELHANSHHPSKESKGKRDTRWLIVALLVPLSVFLVIMLALGIVYCTRCGGEAKPRSVTDCYHWVTGSGPEKGAPPAGVDTLNSRGVV
ncbi:endosialin [Anomaloglossus baeobatrachus]|uniref:endosialin n=1 Tax=Anomaloglossus baeobatrachus TaxID=238106 RepID=UPI003F4F534B